MRVRNWQKFQHFKDRRPPWIKMYREILDDPDWHELDGDSAKYLVMIWLIASENEGALPNTKKLSFRLRISENAAKKVCDKLSHWLEQDDISVISERYQVDTPETETETYKETETEKDKRAPRFDAQAHLVGMGVEVSIASDWVQHRKALKAAPSLTAIDGISKESERAGISLSDALAMCCQRGWRGFKAEWIADAPKAKTYASQKQEADSAYLRAIGLAPKTERLIQGEVL